MGQQKWPQHLRVARNTEGREEPGVCQCWGNWPLLLSLAGRQGLSCKGASLVTQTVKNLPAVQETWVQSLGQEDPLEKGMATHSSILAWKIP